MKNPAKIQTDLVQCDTVNFDFVVQDISRVCAVEFVLTDEKTVDAIAPSELCGVALSK